MRRLISKYQGFHQQVLLAEGPVEFYKKCGFQLATRCDAMWIMNLENQNG